MVGASKLAELSKRPFSIRVFQRKSLSPFTAPTATDRSDPLSGGICTRCRPMPWHGLQDP